MDWFGRKRNRAVEEDRRRYVAVFGVIAGLLKGEAALISSLGKLHFEDENGINGPALGYLYGFADAAMQIAKLELNNEDGRALLKSVYDLYAEGRGEFYLAFIAQGLGRDGVLSAAARDEILSAMKDGGETYARWDTSHGKNVPWGLGKYLGMRDAAGSL
jgi:hypothetical protein